MKNKQNKQNKQNKPWWFPKLLDKAWFKQIRKDYPEHANESNEILIDYFNYGCKYKIEDCCDEQFELLADAYIKLLTLNTKERCQQS